MPLADNLPVRPRARFELKRRYYHRGYLWLWILVIVVPVALRLVMFYDITFPFQSSPNTPVLQRPEELQLYSHPRNNLESPPVTIDDVEFPIIHDSQVIGPDEDAWMIQNDWINHAEDPLKNELSHKRTDEERSTGRHLPVTKIPSDQDIDAVNLGLPENNEEDNVDAGVDEGQLREIGQRLEAIKKWAGQKLNAQEMKRSRLTDEDERQATEQERGNDQRQFEFRQGKEEKKAIKEGEAEEERQVAEEGKERAAEERRAEEEMEVDDDRKIAEEEMMAVKEREVEEERKAPEEREAEEEKKAAVEREGSEEKSTEERKAAQEKEVEEERKADEQREAGGEKKDEEEKSAADTTEADEQKDMEENNADELEEQKTAEGQNESERAVKVEETTEERAHTDDQNQENEKEEEKHEDSHPKYREDNKTPTDQTQGASHAGECDLFDGDWEYDPEGPLYTNSTCFYIRGDHDCMSNGRPDTDFLNWRWKPRGCDLPRFDARAFMESAKGKTISFVGDSLARNQMQSMLCMLSLVEVPIALHDDDLGTRWLYEQHQVTLAAVWAPYLLNESQEGIMGFEKGQSVLYLDVLDPVWTSMLPDLDIIVLSVGQWYLKPSVYIMQDEVIGCHYCPNLGLTEVGFLQAYSGGLRRALEKVAADWKGTVILSTFASAHAEHRPEDDGEQCRRERPLEQEEYESSFRGLHKEMRDIVWDEFNRMVNDDSKQNNDVHIEFLDVSKLSSLRPDGHPGPFVYANPFEGKSPDELVINDCLHWCLPGPVDTWNHLLAKIAHKYL